MRRRRVACLLLVGVLAVLAGCSTGSNPYLTVRNESPERVELQITVVEESPETGETPVYAETVRVAGKSKRSIEIFTGRRTQYRVTARYGNQSVTFPTRPICEDSNTVVTVLPAERLAYHADFCEGPNRTGTSTTVPTET